MNRYEALEFVITKTPVKLQFTRKHPLELVGGYKLSFTRDIRGDYSNLVLTKSPYRYEIKEMSFDFRGGKPGINTVEDVTNYCYDFDIEDLIKGIEGTFASFMYHRLLEMHSMNIGDIFYSIINESRWTKRVGNSFLFTMTKGHGPSIECKLECFGNKIMFKESDESAQKCKIVTMGPKWFLIETQFNRFRIDCITPKRVRKPCSYCDGNRTLIKCDRGSVFINKSNDDRPTTFEFNNSYGTDPVRVEINYCPICGRKLKGAKS